MLDYQYLRVGSAAQTKAMKKVAGSIKLELLNTEKWLLLHNLDQI